MELEGRYWPGKRGSGVLRWLDLRGGPRGQTGPGSPAVTGTVARDGVFPAGTGLETTGLETTGLDEAPGTATGDGGTLAMAPQGNGSPETATRDGGTPDTAPQENGTLDTTTRDGSTLEI